MNYAICASHRQHENLFGCTCPIVTCFCSSLPPLWASCSPGLFEDSVSVSAIATGSCSSVKKLVSFLVWIHLVTVPLLCVSFHHSTRMVSSVFFLLQWLQQFSLTTMSVCLCHVSGSPHRTWTYCFCERFHSQTDKSETDRTVLCATFCVFHVLVSHGVVPKAPSSRSPTCKIPTYISYLDGVSAIPAVMVYVGNRGVVNGFVGCHQGVPHAIHQRKPSTFVLRVPAPPESYALSNSPSRSALTRGSRRFVLENFSEEKRPNVLLCIFQRK